MSVRAKFKVNSKTIDLYPMGKGESLEQHTINMTPVGQGDSEPSFWEASPSGSMQLGIVNPAAWEFFEIGESYYLDFTKAEG